MTVTMVKENRKTFTIKEVVGKLSFRAKILVPKERLTEEDLLFLRELEANPSKRELIKESLIKRINQGKPISKEIFLKKN